MVKQICMWSKDIDEALQYLNGLIEEGLEFPDAVWRTTQNFNVGHLALVTAYDEQGV